MEGVGAVQCGAHGARGAMHMCSCMCVCINEGAVHVGRCGAVGRGSRCIKKHLYRSKTKINMFSSLTAWLFGEMAKLPMLEKALFVNALFVIQHCRRD